ncbi:MAG TPA: cupin domain-containing protein [Alphaproteobacteria bacterium]|nr:cupin domain-containing protein [Alphaproteobacteria bacterium]
MQSTAPCFHEWDKVEEVPVIPGYRAKFMHSANMTFVLWDIDAGAPLPEHAHPHEQVAHLLAGTFELVINGKPNVLQAGSTAVIPSNAVHSGKAITPCRILDAFYPLREDYLKENMQKTILQNASR